MAGYYDMILGLIPLTLAGVSGVLVAAGMALSVAVPMAGLVAIILIGHAMFVRSPSRDPRPATTTTDAPGFNSAD